MTAVDEHAPLFSTSELWIQGSDKKRDAPPMGSFICAFRAAFLRKDEEVVELTLISQLSSHPMTIQVTHRAEDNDIFGDFEVKRSETTLVKYVVVRIAVNRRRVTNRLASGKNRDEPKAVPHKWMLAGMCIKSKSNVLEQRILKLEFQMKSKVANSASEGTPFTDYFKFLKNLCNCECEYDLDSICGYQKEYQKAMQLLRKQAKVKKGSKNREEALVPEVEDPEVESSEDFLGATPELENASPIEFETLKRKAEHHLTREELKDQHDEFLNYFDAFSDDGPCWDGEPNAENPFFEEIPSLENQEWITELETPLLNQWWRVGSDDECNLFAEGYETS